MDSADHYRLLGLQPGATAAEIKVAYRELAKRWHPDQFTNSLAKHQAETELKKINAAYTYLKELTQPTTNETTGVPTNTGRVNVATKPKTAADFCQLGIEQVQNRHWQEALESFSQAIKLNPNDPDAYRHRAGVCQQLGYEHRAASDLKNAERLRPRPAEDFQSRPKPQPTSPSPEDQVPQTGWQVTFHFLAHDQAVKMLTLTPNQTLLVTAGADHRIKLWNLQTQTLTQTLKVPDFHFFALHPNGQEIVTAGANSNLQTWQIENGQSKQLFLNHPKLRFLGFSPTGDYLLSLSKEGHVKAWHWQFQQLAQVFKDFSFTSLAFPTDGQTVLLGDAVGQVHHYQLSNGRKLGSFLALPSRHTVSGMTLTADGQTLATYSVFEKEIQLWQWSSQQPLLTIQGHERPPLCAKFSPDGQVLATGSPDRRLKTWKVNSGKPCHSLEVAEFFDFPTTLAFSADGQTLYTGWDKGALRIWQWRS